MTEPPADYHALLLQALGAVEDLQAKLVAAEKVQTEPIALIGIGCRFPGGADSAEAFWQLLERGENAVVEVPADRWDIERYYSPDRDAPGKMYSRHGGFLGRVDEFEPEFFGISPREARTLDPQQRLVLEVAWEALEHGGVPPTSLRESQTGVFVGIGGSDFTELQMRGGDLGEVDAYVGTGGGPCFAAGRLSYVLGLRGPSLAVDTACSSSLVALHLAFQSLRQRECDLALAGGVHVMLSPFVSVYLSRTQALSSDGRSKVFDASADGFVRGEGCGMVVLKRLSDAVEARDPIIAVVRGSGLTQDGASSGLTVPNGPAQAAAVRAALQQARLEPAAIGYVEAHGTGTSLGDPIEMNALCSVLGEGRSPASPFAVGSVKSNIGHLEAAAGVAGFIKAALVVQRGVVPPHLHFTRWNPEIDFQGTTVVLPSSPYPWPPAGGSRYAGVSAFGLSGTNAHVVIGEAPVVQAEVRAAGVERSRFAMRVTARSAPALAELGGRLAAHLRTGATADLADACYTANVGRAHFGHRAVVVGDTLDSVREGLEALAGQREDARVVKGTVDRAEPTVAFLFPGQGAQYAGMGQSLYRTQAVFRDALDRCDALLREHLDMPLLRVLYPPPGEATPIDETRYAQPVLLAFEYALASLWQAWGVRPAALLGHSLGEYAAACVAGLLPLEHALRLVAVRGRLMGSLPPHGAMTAVFASEAQVREAMRGEQGALSIAAINGPENVVISGARDAVQRAGDRLVADGVDVRPLNVPHAAHSALLEPILDEFERTVARAGFGRATVPIISNVTGQPLTEAQQRDPGYWRRHAREAVRYADGVRTLNARGIRYFVEMGPHTTACGMAAPCIPGSGAVLVPSLRKGRDDWEQLLESLSMLYVRGAAVDWESVDEGSARRRVHLPTYAFQRERHWPEETHRSDRPPQADSSAHPVLTGKVELADEPRSVVWEGVLDTAQLPYLEDHRVQGVPVVPATMYMELALAAGRDGAAGTGIALRDVDFHRPLLVSSGSRASIQVKLVRDAHGSAAYRIHSRRGPGDGWMLHSTGIVELGEPNPPVTPMDALENVRRRCTVPVTGAEFYARMAERGNQWGPTFQGVSRLWQGESEALSQIEVPEAIAGQLERYYLHPALADASGQVLAATISLMSEGGARAGAFVGGGIDAVRLVRRPQGRRFWAHARIRPVTPGQDRSVLVGDVTLMDEAGETLCVTEGARFWYLDHKGDELADSQVGLYQTEWIPQPDKAAAPSVLSPMLIFADDAGVGAALLEQLRANGGSGKVVTRGAEYAAIGERFQVRSGERDDYGKVLAALGDTDSPATVLFLWGLDSAAARGSDIDLVPARCAERCRELLYLVQAAARRSSSIQLRVWVVTARAQPIDADGDCDPLPAAIWGLGRTIKAEHQELWGGLIDTDALAEPTTAAAQILRILLGPEASGEDQIAVRGAERFVPRLRRFEPPRRAPFACSPSGTYLVTGGLGGLGLEVARWFASRGAQHLVLLGRTPLPPRAAWTSMTPDSAAHERIQHVRELEARGLQVCYAAVDVGDERQLSAFLESYGRLGWPSIRGVVHAAGLMQYQPLATQTEADMREIFQSKVSGGWNLHRAFATELDFFVLFSSAAAILPSPLVGSYAAANAFLDGLAHLRRANGQAALSINWGAWTEVGMGARFAIENPQDTRDTDHAFSPAEGIAAMERLITGGASQATVLGSDWTRWRDQYPQLARSPFMHELMAGASAKAVSRGAEHQGLVLGLLRARTGEERSRAARSYLAECVGSVLGFAPNQLDVDQPISNLGFDSMMALELKSRIARELQLIIPLVRLLDGPSVAQVAEVVATALNARGSADVDRNETADGAAVGVAPEAWDEGTI